MSCNTHDHIIAPGYDMRACRAEREPGARCATFTTRYPGADGTWWEV